jgi:hypothetical protein
MVTAIGYPIWPSFVPFRTPAPEYSPAGVLFLDFFLENGTLRDTRETNPDVGSKNVI